MNKRLTAPANLDRLIATMSSDILDEDGLSLTLEWVGGRFVTSTFQWDGPQNDITALRFAEWRVINGDTLVFQSLAADATPTITFIPGAAEAVLHAPLVAFAAIAGISPSDLYLGA
jgi:hypothetical protein